MRYTLFRVSVQAANPAEEGKPSTLDEDSPTVLTVAVEVPAEYARNVRGEGGEGNLEAVPLQQQIRQALEAARPGQ